MKNLFPLLLCVVLLLLKRVENSAWCHGSVELSSTLFFHSQEGKKTNNNNLLKQAVYFNQACCCSRNKYVPKSPDACLELENGGYFAGVHQNSVLVTLPCNLQE